MSDGFTAMKGAGELLAPNNGRRVLWLWCNVKLGGKSSAADNRIRRGSLCAPLDRRRGDWLGALLREIATKLFGSDRAERKRLVKGFLAGAPESRLFTYRQLNPTL